MAHISLEGEEDTNLDWSLSEELATAQNSDFHLIKNLTGHQKEKKNTWEYKAQIIDLLVWRLEAQVMNGSWGKSVFLMKKNIQCNRDVTNGFLKFCCYSLKVGEDCAHEIIFLFTVRTKAKPSQSTMQKNSCWGLEFTSKEFYFSHENKKNIGKNVH